MKKYFKKEILIMEINKTKISHNRKTIERLMPQKFYTLLIETITYHSLDPNILIASMGIQHNNPWLYGHHESEMLFPDHCIIEMIKQSAEALARLKYCMEGGTFRLLDISAVFVEDAVIGDTVLTQVELKREMSKKVFTFESFASNSAGKICKVKEITLIFQEGK
jgi:3-hydroxymyristoyl/3-hydroxydecanoyl-(acyl carrier protein) dehydratase